MRLLFPITEIFFDEIPSTNSFLLENHKLFKEWTVVSTQEQNAGKGYAGNQWKSTNGKNLTFSILIRPDFPIQSVFYLNKMVANAVHHVIHPIVPSQIKWPNDLIIQNKKTAGILIENIVGKKLHTSVIGIGLNVNQTHFENLPKATSLQNETGIDFDLEELRLSIIATIQHEYQRLINQEFESIDFYYHNHLYKKDQVAVFEYQNQLENGIIKGTNFDGQLVIELENSGLKNFSLKEIKMMY